MLIADHPWLEPAWQQLLRQANQGQAFLLHGQAGLGKRQLAEALICHWLGVEQLHPAQADVLVIDGEQGIKIDQIRAAISQLAQTAHDSQGKVLLLLQAERMSESAANALLKTLEEPAGDTRILLTSDRAADLLPTIRSRCLAVNIKTPSAQQSCAWLQQVLGQQLAADRLPIQRALLFSAGSPLQAREMLEQDQLRLPSELLQKLQSVRNAPEQLPLLAEQIAEHQHQGVQWILAIAYQGVRQITGRSSRLLDLPLDFSLQQWLRLVDESQQLLAQLRKQPGLNLTLHLQCLLQAFVK